MPILTKLIDRLAALGPWRRQLVRGQQISGTMWDDQYQRGMWAHLHSEGVRYEALVSLCADWKRLPSILDVGCGEGILLDYFRRTQTALSHYVGLDISVEAIKQARLRYPSDRFEVVDVENYKPASLFDIIVFNECLNCVRRPLEVVRTFESGLAADGLFIVSLYDPIGSGSQRIWKHVCSVYDCLSQQAITDSENLRWNIGVFRPRVP